jgi:hypothetical protein
MLVLVLALLAGGCTMGDDRADDRRPGGFYVGAGGGISRP